MQCYVYVKEVKVGNQTQQYSDHSIVIDHATKLGLQLASLVPDCLENTSNNKIPTGAVTTHHKHLRDKQQEDDHRKQNVHPVHAEMLVLLNRVVTNDLALGVVAHHTAYHGCNYRQTHHDGRDRRNHGIDDLVLQNKHRN